LASRLRFLLEQDKTGRNCSAGRFDEIKLPNLLLTASATGQTGVSRTVTAKNVKQSANDGEQLGRPARNLNVSGR
jgi:hypothetical protein